MGMHPHRRQKQNERRENLRQVLEPFPGPPALLPPAALSCHRVITPDTLIPVSPFLLDQGELNTKPVIRGPVDLLSFSRYKMLGLQDNRICLFPCAQTVEDGTSLWKAQEKRQFNDPNLGYVSLGRTPSKNHLPH
jgi:hypothetical protein